MDGVAIWQPEVEELWVGCSAENEITVRSAAAQSRAQFDAISNRFDSNEGISWGRPIRPLFQAGRCVRMAGKFGVCMMDPPIRYTLPQRQPDIDGAVYHIRCAVAAKVCLEPKLHKCFYAAKVGFYDHVIAPIIQTRCFRGSSH
jgi:hypothetical protein